MDEFSDNATLPEEATIPEAMLLAVGWHRDGNVRTAAEVYRQWIFRDPVNPVARHLLAACPRENVPWRASDAYITTTFDSFATSFDDVMARLNYYGGGCTKCSEIKIWDFTPGNN